MKNKIKVTLYPYTLAILPHVSYAIKKIVGALTVEAHDGGGRVIRAGPGNMISQRDAEALVRENTIYEVTVVEAPAGNGLYPVEKQNDAKT